MRHRYRCACAQRPLAAATPAHLQAFLPVDPQQLLVVGRQPLPGKEVAQSPVAEPTALPGQLPQALAQGAVVGPHWFIPDDPTRNADDVAGTALAEPELLADEMDRPPLRVGRHQFFPAISFSAALSSMASASNRFRRAFSSSSAFSRRASDISRPPYL